MKKKAPIAAVILLLILTVPLAAQTVYLEELETAAESDSIQFRNYTGPHSKIDTIAQIRGIGSFLGREVDRETAEFSYFGRYRVIHAVDYSVIEGLDADIFVIEPSAAVDHIDNLRRMVSGYLETAYDYSVDRADMLAKFITIYNAVHRNDMDYFRNTYKKIVMGYLSEDKAGLALSYQEWPGKTMMLIPLTPRAGDGALGDLDSDVLTDDKVIEKLRTEEGRGIEPRQEMVELKEDEIEEERKEIDEERSELEDRKREVSERQEEQEDSEEPADEEVVEADEAELEKIAEAEKELDEREEAVERREEQIIAERDAIAEDQMAEMEEEEGEPAAADTAESSEEKPAAPAAPGKTVPFLRLSESSGGYTGQLLLVDPENGKILKYSEVDSIRMRGYTYSADEIYAVAGSSGGNRIVSIVTIDPESLEIEKSGTEEVYYDSAIVKHAAGFYAVVKKDDNWRIGSFDRELQLSSFSEISVFPATSVVVFDGGLIVQNTSGSIVKLDPDEFNQIR